MSMCISGEIVKIECGRRNYVITARLPVIDEEGVDKKEYDEPFVIPFSAMAAYESQTGRTLTVGMQILLNQQAPLGLIEIIDEHDERITTLNRH